MEGTCYQDDLTLPFYYLPPSVVSYKENVHISGPAVSAVCAAIPRGKVRYYSLALLEDWQMMVCVNV